MYKLLIDNILKQQSVSLIPLVEEGGVNFKGLDGYDNVEPDEMIEIANNAIASENIPNSHIDDYINHYEILNDGVDKIAGAIDVNPVVLRDQLVDLCLASNALRDIMSFVIDMKLSFGAMDVTTHADLIESLEACLGNIESFDFKPEFVTKKDEMGRYEFDVFANIGEQRILFIQGADSGYGNINLTELKLAFVMYNSIKAFLDTLLYRGSVSFDSPIYLQLRDVYWHIELHTVGIE